MKSVILYGLGGAEKQYRALCYWQIPEEQISIEEIRYQALSMKVKNPSVKMIFAIDNRVGLKGDYIRSYRTNSIESCAIFKDILERGAIRIL